MKYGYKEVRKVDPIALRGLCIKKNWYTNGTNAEYDELLNYGYNDKLITSDELVEMATLIKEHSDTDYEITSIMYEINAECCYSYFEEC